MNGKPEARRYGHEDAASCCTIELRHDQSGHPRPVPEYLDLGERILPGRCIEHQKNRVRRGGIQLAQHTHDLLELVHQALLVLQATRGIDQEHITARFPCRLERIEGEACGIRSDLVRDYWRARALAPDLELVDGCGAEGIARGHHDRAAGALELLRKLADRRRLAGAID